MSETLQAVRGMNDILPEDTPAWEYFEQTVAKWLRAYGYRNIRTPVLERTELFVRSIGEVTDIVEKEMYSFVDALNGETLTLRPEGTAACVRAVLQHNLLYPGPQRLAYAGPMFRHERPQKGRYRQFHQVGVEALGFAGPDVDVEHIAMCARLWKALGLDGIRLQINTLGGPVARARYRGRLTQYLEAHQDHLDEDARRRLHTNPLRVLDTKNSHLAAVVAGAPRLLDDLEPESLAHFEQLQEMIRALGLEFEVNPRLVRGLDYYNLTVFEWITDRLGAQSAVCAGGRYDGLVAQLGGKPQPACGFAMGVERLLALMQDAGQVAAPWRPEIYLAHSGEGAQAHALRVVEQMRDQGLSAVLHCGGGSFKSQMKKADASGALFALIVGEEEARAGKVSLKPLREGGEQVSLDAGEAARRILAARPADAR